MAHLYQTDGRVKEIHPPNGGKYFTLPELQAIVGGYIEMVRTVDGEYMVINEMGKLEGLELNIWATRIYQHGRHDPIVGNAIVFATKADIEPDDDEVEQ
jgi:hypothetical protein